MEVEVLEGKGTDFYKNLNITIKKNIVDVWASFGTVKPLYQFHRIKCDKKNYVKYLVLFLSPVLSNNIFNFNLLYSRNKLISNLLDLLLKAHLLEKSNSINPINFDVFSGKIFLEPQLKKKEDDVEEDESTVKKNSVSAFSFNLSYNDNDFMLKSSIKHERYLLEKCNVSLDIYDDFCSLNNYKYVRKLEAREQARPFFNFKNYGNYFSKLYRIICCISLLMCWACCHNENA